MKKAYFNWSSGKDSSLALYHAIQSGEYEVETLFSTVSMEGGKISMHEISAELLKRQAEAIGIPLTIFSFAAVDLCGENGEYHSFVFDGPIFRHPVNFRVMGKYYRDYPDLRGEGLHRYCYLGVE